MERNKEMNTYVISFPGGTTEVESPMNFHDFQNSIAEQIEQGSLNIEPAEGLKMSVLISKNQHFSYTIMTKQVFLRMRAEQAFNGAGAQSPIARG